jgi:GAF domain-containing protein
MAEATLDLRALPKAEAYEELAGHVASVLAGIEDHIAAMASISALTHHAFGFLWTGFYRLVRPTLLRIGPYQGTLGCLEIPVGQGVCGSAARDRKTIIVPDVATFPGHITCDARSRSEIVVPVFDGSGSLIGVFDIDSERRGTFDEADRAGLERLVAWFARPAT